jgi:plastocyanin
MKKIAAALVLIVASLALAACGGGGSYGDGEGESGGAPSGGASGGASGAAQAEGGTAATPSSVQFEADPSGNLEFTADQATVQAGKVNVAFTNLSGVPHDVAIEDASGKTVGETDITPKGSTATVVDLQPGTYTFYCSVPGHREAGMEGTLTVK